ncbi:GNAT family N-acetyltransferase [Luteolibacter sp. Populi]|uniref:GNAT family N-acetyltransferase n=1 Tax=Luteolibacter sp. Populi TaxID=3230487 RepID=UPI003465B5E7
MKIRAAIDADLPVLARIYLQGRRDIFTWQDHASFRLEDFAEQTAGEAIRVAEDGDAEVTGFLSVWEAENFVHHLFVADGHRGTGTGRALLEDLRSRMPGPFRLKCIVANTAALDFYRRLGWTVAGHGEAEGSPYLLMEWGKLPAGLLRRAATDADLGFLWELHVLTMRDYVEQTWGWESLWQEENFRKFFDFTVMEILEVDGEPVGAISVEDQEDRLYLRNIEIHPAWQNRGIGTVLVTEFIELARAKSLPARLQVLKVNPARRLYERMGFELCGETETHFLMEHPVQE